jgi:hypothetical protein
MFNNNLKREVAELKHKLQLSEELCNEYKAFYE